jgi:hypothetical protein
MGKKGKGGQGEEERKGGIQVLLQGPPRRQGKQEVASRRWHRGLLGAPRRCSCVPTKKTSANFAKSPLGKGDFWGVFKLRIFGNIC